MATLEKAFEIAYNAHKHQTDKSGEMYILHPIRVMLKQKSNEAKIVAILHDTVEDTWITLEWLKQMGFSDEIVDAVDAISRRKDESIKEYYKRIMEIRLAMKVKIADLEDNLDSTRLSIVNEKDLNRIRIYHKYWSKLTDMISI